MAEADTVEQPFLTDVQTLRSRARDHMMDGAVTSSYGLDLKQAVAVLNQALATEMVCVLRYKRHAYMAKGPNSEPIAAEFATHASEEQAHADQIAERIVQLGGAPDFNPAGLLSRSHSQYVEGASLREMVEENLIAERIAIDSYREMSHWFGSKDSTTRRMLEGILAQEEEHADDMADLLERHQGV
jgi:bacterioferritin